MANEVVSKQSDSSESTLPLLYWLCMLVGAAILMFVCWAAWRAGGWKSALIGLGVLVAYLSLSGLVWTIANALRVAAMPDAFFSSGFIETLSKKLFWAIGPQCIGMAIWTAASVFVIVHWAIPRKPPKVPVVIVQEIADASVAAGADMNPATSNVQGDCFDPVVVPTLQSEWLASVSRTALLVRGVAVTLEQLAPHVDLTFSNIRDVSKPDMPYATCMAAVTQRASGLAIELGETSYTDPDLAYWVTRENDGRLLVEIAE